MSLPEAKSTAPTPTNSRNVVVELLNRWEAGRTYADQLLHEVLAESALPDARDRALATDMFYGVLRNLRLLDYLLEPCIRRPLDLPVRNALRMGLYQLLFTRIPEHAAVDSSVNCAGHGRSLVNAILRGLLRDWPKVQQAGANAPLAVRASHPDFLVKRWRSFLSEPELGALLEWNNAPPENYVRLNTLKTATFEELPQADALCLAQEEPPAMPTGSVHPLFRRVDQLPLGWLREGLVYAQDPSTAIACELLAPMPGESILDACAAPGGKSCYMAALMHGQGRLVATDAEPERLNLLRKNAETQAGDFITVRQVHWGKPGAEQILPDLARSFDGVLVDVPCSNTGVLRRRVDARWRLTPEEFARMAETQLAILQQVAEFVKPAGGRLLYSTCSVDPQENEEVIRAFLGTRLGKEFRLAEVRSSTPWRDQIDGSYAALLTRQ